MILFNHIPRTGGTSLRIILNKVYGEDKIFFIKSKDIKSSIELFSRFSQEKKDKFQVISGHGAELFNEFIHKPFLLSILREPVSLFLSQYEYLKMSNNSVFLEKVKEMKSIEEYMDFAIKMGQDNLLTRYLSGSLDFLIDATSEIPDMQSQGHALLEKAIKNMHTYDALLSTDNFDKGVFHLSELLKWQGIPLYRPRNFTSLKKTHSMDGALKKHLDELLKYDLELYQYFLDKKLDIASMKGSLKRSVFISRQFLANLSSFFLKDN